MSVTAGVDVGNKREHSGICIAEADVRSVANRIEYHFLVRHLQRVPAGTTFPRLADRVGEVAEALSERSAGVEKIYLNATGLGEPIVELMESRLGAGGSLQQVFFNHGDRRIEEKGIVTLGKAYLVARLQMLLQSDRLHLPRTTEARVFAQELTDYAIDLPPDANERYGAFRVGSQDDLVTALGLAVQIDHEGRGAGQEYVSL